ncbi:MAG: EF-hand domain-containing protein [Rhizobiaceae bacterium]
MKRLSLVFAIIGLMTAPAAAQSDLTSSGKELAETIFGSITKNPDGRLDMGEFVNFGNMIKASMDANDDAKIDFEEFTTFDFGFQEIGKETGQERAFDTAQKVLFAFWDRDGNGMISASEFHKSMISDFQRADVDDDAFLSKDEFLHNYVVNRAYRAALSGS